jgi:dolichol-phosphate mannosyltransferase
VRPRRKVVVVVPFLNEADNLPLLYERLTAVLEKQPESFGLLFVDDGSTDSSAGWLASRARHDPRVKLLRLSRNFGHQLAITAGMDHADGDAVVIMDADLQDPPEVVPDLLARWREGFDIVYGVRRSRSGESWLKRFLAATFYKTFRRMASVEVPLDAGDFRLVDRKVIDALKQVRELHRFVRGLTCWVGFLQTAVHYERAPRHAGVTKYPV